MSNRAIRLLERWLPPEVSPYVVGDLVERDVRGMRLWLETISALWSLRRDPTPGDTLVSSF